MVPFHSNPSPRNISWEIRGEGTIGMDDSIGRFTSEGWEEYVSAKEIPQTVSTLIKHFRMAPHQTTSPELVTPPLQHSLWQC